MNWGTKIFISFVLFMSIIITMVVISMNQNISLVATDYYKQEIAYQDQIDKLENAKVSNKLKFNYESKDMSFVISSSASTKGEVHFYRPADASKDIKVAFETQGNQVKVISTKGMQKGLWKVKLNWKEAEKDFYAEKTIII